MLKKNLSRSAFFGINKDKLLKGNYLIGETMTSLPLQPYLSRHVLDCCDSMKIYVLIGKHYMHLIT